MIKKVAIIGSRGYVGRAYAGLFGKKHETVEVDLTIDIPMAAQQEAANKCDLAVICVPTPMNEDGSVDTSAVENTVKWLETPLILIKSTIPPGTTQRLIDETDKHIVFSPEYIGEGGYAIPYWKDWPHPTDASLHSFMITGGEKSDCLAVVQFIKPILGPDCRFAFTDPTTAELVKYSENAFLATKVSFCNELFDVAKSFGVDYDELRELWLLDGRIGRSHTLVFPDNRGWGGKCLPKDTSGIVHAAEDAGCSMDLLKAVIAVNKKHNDE